MFLSKFILSNIYDFAALPIFFSSTSSIALREEVAVCLLLFSQMNLNLKCNISAIIGWIVMKIDKLQTLIEVTSDDGKSAGARCLLIANAVAQLSQVNRHKNDHSEFYGQHFMIINSISGECCQGTTAAFLHLSLWTYSPPPQVPLDSEHFLFHVAV